ncbi:unnamed protein product [Sympodiomycopsis kandeliae]
MDAETASVSGIKPKTLLPVGGKHEVPGSSKKPWVIKRCEGGFYTCTCGGFQTSPGSTRKRTCAHLKEVLGEEYEQARKRMEAQSKKPEVINDNKRKEPSPSFHIERLTAVQNKAGGPSGSTTMSQHLETDYEDLVASQGEDANKKQKPNGLEYDNFTGSVTFNGRQRTKGYDKYTAVLIMLSESCDPNKMDPTGWWMSEKLDGVRAYWTGERLISRSNMDWRAPKWFIDKLPKGFALDGELWRERDGFEELSGMCRRADNSGWGTINYFVFDAPDLNLPFEERIKAALQRMPDGEMSPDEALRGKFGGRIAMLPQIRCQGKDHLLSYLDEIEKQCGEGVMLRRPKSPYERKRSRHSLKLKSTYDAEALVVGYTAGKGRHYGEMGSLGLLMECGTIFTCGSGLTNEMRKAWAPQRGSIVRYRFSELTADHVPRFPVFVGVCPDRTAPKDAVCRTTDFRTERKIKDLIEGRYRKKAPPGSDVFGTKVVTMSDLVLGKPN